MDEASKGVPVIEEEDAAERETESEGDAVLDKHRDGEGERDGDLL